MCNNLGRLFLLICLMFLTLSVEGQIRQNPDDKLYDQSFVLRGKVTILNHPTLGKTEGRNVRIVFQKIGCKNCLIFITSDSDGNYLIGLGRGKYKIIMREVRGGVESSYDLLAPFQTRIIDASKSRGTVDFDIQMMLPKN